MGAAFLAPHQDGIIIYYTRQELYDILYIQFVILMSYMCLYICMNLFLFPIFVAPLYSPVYFCIYQFGNINIHLTFVQSIC